MKSTCEFESDFSTRCDNIVSCNNNNLMSLDETSKWPLILRKLCCSNIIKLT